MNRSIPCRPIHTMLSRCIMRTSETKHMVVLNSWAMIMHTYTCDPNLEKNEITRNFLWWNDGIMIGNKSIKYKDWCQKGVRFVNDLLTDNGNFLEYTDFCNLYQLNSNILNYYGIVNELVCVFIHILCCFRSDYHLFLYFPPTFHRLFFTDVI